MEYKFQNPDGSSDVWGGYKDFINRLPRHQAFTFNDLVRHVVKYLDIEDVKEQSSKREELRKKATLRNWLSYTKKLRYIGSIRTGIYMKLKDLEKETTSYTIRVKANSSKSK